MSLETKRRRSSAFRMNTVSLGSVRQWHWVSSAICLAGLLLFAITGFTLNHAASIESAATTVTVELEIPAPQLEALEQLLAQHATTPTPPDWPPALANWVQQQTSERIQRQQLEAAQWSASELYISLPRPGGDAWLVLDADMGELLYERTHRGAVAYLNDLHKGRNTGAAWSLFIDFIALACVVFAITGLWLLIRQQRQRPTTWAITTLGLLIPLLIVLLHRL
ncbi:hypothetical protein CWE07_06990 [Aliidiomarina maris]|uniref:PepSY-associated transmembrane protein n=2 Tax=Aliidiomarina maris TaxID=531312 RepID=A0ABY0BRR5_9GAMM|nr:hypothetical protein CWE07_06990 [Aliidiomarina maris]